MEPLIFFDKHNALSVIEEGQLMFIYETENAIVRIHPGKLTEEERKVVLENAARKYYEAIQKQKQKSA